jgi:hypothetical protein
MRIPTGHFRKTLRPKRKYLCGKYILYRSYPLWRAHYLRYKNGEYVPSAGAYQEAASHFLIKAKFSFNPNKSPARAKKKRKKNINCWNEVTDGSFVSAWLIERRVSLSFNSLFRDAVLVLKFFR